MPGSRSTGSSRLAGGWCRTVGDEPVRRAGCRGPRVHHGDRARAGRLPVVRRSEGGRRGRGQAFRHAAGRRRAAVGEVLGWAPEGSCLRSLSPLPFLYEATGDETMFTDGFDPDPRVAPVLAFHRPETLARQLRQLASTTPTPARCAPDCNGSNPVPTDGLRRDPGRGDQRRSKHR